MSIKCPKCGTEIEQDFGLVTCSNCTSVFSVDVDGNAQIAGEEFHQNTQTAQVIEAAGDAETETPVPEEPLQFATEIEPVAESEPEPELEPELEPEITKTWAAPKDAFQEIRDFGNKEVSAGPISYSITIEDLNVAERIEAVLEALSDPKFGWETSALSKKIKSGTMKLVDLNPAAAVMVIKKLRGIHVKVSWTQSLYS